jgi:hypothetical protein
MKFPILKAIASCIAIAATAYAPTAESNLTRANGSDTDCIMYLKRQESDRERLRSPIAVHARVAPIA